MGQVDALGFRDQAKHLPVAIETPRPTSFADFQAGFAITIKEHHAGLPGRVLVRKLDSRGTVPLDIHNRDQAIRQDALDSRSSFESFKLRHEICTLGRL